MEYKYIVLLKNLRFSKLAGIYTYYYVCCDNSFMNLSEATDDLENIGTYEQVHNSYLSQFVIHNYLEQNNIKIVKEEKDLILFALRNDQDNNCLNSLIDHIKYNGYK